MMSKHDERDALHFCTVLESSFFQLYKTYIFIGGSELQSKCLRLQLGQMIASLQKRTAQARSLKPSRVYIAGYCLKHNCSQFLMLHAVHEKVPLELHAHSSASPICTTAFQRMGALGVFIHGHFLIYLWQMQSLPPTPLSFSATGEWH